MRLFPPFKKTIVEIQNPEVFYKYMSSITEGLTTKQGARLVGQLNNQGFKVERLSHIQNTFRPVIRGFFVKETGKPDILVIQLDSKRNIIIASVIFIVLSTIGTLARHPENTWKVALVLSLMIYLMLMIGRLLSLTPTYIEIDNILEKAKES